MADVLSQEEVDALLKGVQEGQIDTKEKAPPEDVKPFDLTGKERIFHYRVPIIERLNESFARRLRIRLTSSFGRYIDVDFKGTEVRRFSEFIAVVIPPASYSLLKIESNLPLLIMIEGTVVFSLVEFFFGGSSATIIKRKASSFTPLEQKIIERILNEMVDVLTECWKEVMEVRFTKVAIEENPEYIAEVNPTDHIFGAEFEVTMDEVTGKLYILYPQQTVDIIKDRIGSMDTTQGLSKQAFTEWIETSLREAILNLSVELDTVEITLEELLSLREGDILSLSKSPEDHLVLKIEGIPKFMIKAGTRRGSVAVKILREINL